MYKTNPVNVRTHLEVVSSPELSKSIAEDLLVPDPTGIIAKESRKANENPTKYDRGSGSFNNIQDLFPSSQ